MCFNNNRGVGRAMTLTFLFDLRQFWPWPRSRKMDPRSIFSKGLFSKVQNYGAKVQMEKVKVHFQNVYFPKVQKYGPKVQMDKVKVHFRKINFPKVQKKWT